MHSHIQLGTNWKEKYISCGVWQMLSQTPRSQTPASSFVLCIEFYLEKKTTFHCWTLNIKSGKHSKCRINHIWPGLTLCPIIKECFNQLIRWTWVRLRYFWGDACEGDTSLSSYHASMIEVSSRERGAAQQRLFVVVLPPWPGLGKQSSRVRKAPTRAVWRALIFSSSKLSPQLSR